ncbi:hypothetical protein NIES4073_76280 [Kalymmatonema gypsitolerans NIES-4073]|nr:hypothetical protein NIES4073_76280 [Scytonema sp. NIES-4073]
MLVLLAVVFAECTALGGNMQCDLNMCQVLKAEAKDSPRGKLKIGVSLAKRSPKVGVYCRLCHPVCPKSLHSVRFRNVLNVISNEAYEFMRYAGGFDTIDISEI